MSDPLGRLRRDLDAADRQLIGMLARRMRIIREVSEVKRAQQIPVQQDKRIQDVLQDRSALAEEAGLRAPFVRDIFRVIIDEAMRIEEQER